MFLFLTLWKSLSRTHQKNPAASPPKYSANLSQLLPICHHCPSQSHSQPQPKLLQELPTHVPPSILALHGLSLAQQQGEDRSQHSSPGRHYRLVKTGMPDGTHLPAPLLPPGGKAQKGRGRAEVLQPARGVSWNGNASGKGVLPTKHLSYSVTAPTPRERPLTRGRRAAGAERGMQFAR